MATLPAAGLVPDTVRYLHHPVILNYHYYVSDENILQINPRTEAVLADYERSGGRALLLLAAYPDASTAQQALTRFFGHFLPDAAEDGFALMENKKWSTATRRDNMLAVVLESDSRQLAADLLAEIHPPQEGG
jgi:hypothetical protein